MTPTRNTPTSVVIKVRMASGCTWQARGGRRGFLRVASSTIDPTTAACRCAAKALHTTEAAITLAVIAEPKWDTPGSYRATAQEVQS